MQIQSQFMGRPPAVGKQEPLLFPLPETFRRLGVGPTKGFALLKEGRLKAVTVMGRRMVAGVEIDRVVREGA